MKKAFIPAFFIHGKDDDFIVPKHSEDLHAAYSGGENADKRIKIVEGYFIHNLVIIILIEDSRFMKLWLIFFITDSMFRN